MLLSDICGGCRINTAPCALRQYPGVRLPCGALFIVFFRGARREAPDTPEKQIFSRPVAPKARSGGGLAPDTSEKTLYPSAPQGRRTLSGFNLM